MRLMMQSLKTSDSSANLTVNVRVATYNIYYLSNVGNASFLAAEKHILRADADILFLTEVNNTLYSNLAATVASGWGYNHIVRGETGDFGCCMLSKYPILDSQLLSSAYINSITGNVGAVEMPISTGIMRTRHEIEGVNFIAYGGHFNTGMGILESTVPQEGSSYARWVNMYRVFQDIAIQEAAYPDVKMVIMGDYNNDDDITQWNSFSSTPDVMPNGWVGGADLQSLFPVQHAIWPTLQLSGYNWTLLNTFDLAMVRSTWIWRVVDPNNEYYPYKFDYISHSPNVQSVGSEILFSENDSNSGLPKVGAPLAFADSETASDHKMVFADLKV